MTENAIHYQRPDAFTRRVLNPFVAWLTRRGISVWGSRILEVPGRRSGQWRSNPVNLHVVGGVEYLVAPRGVTDWVRNLRASGTGRLRLGRRRWEFDASEVADDHKVEILRDYLRRWSWEAGMFFDGVDAKSTDDALRAIAPCNPVFVLALEAAS